MDMDVESLEVDMKSMDMDVESRDAEKWERMFFTSSMVFALT